VKFTNFPLVMTSHKRDTLKRNLKRRGWTHQAAATELGVTYEHLNRVLNGHRESASLLAAVANLPKRQEVAAP